MRYIESVLFLAVAATLTGCPGTGAIFTVNTTADTPDTNPGDGLCQDAAGSCSLRAAVEEANEGLGAELRLTSGQTYVLSSGPLALEKSMTITGAFAADGTTAPDLPNATVIPTPAKRIFEVGKAATSSAAAVQVTLTAKNLTLQGARLRSGAGGANVGGAVVISTGSSFVGENVNALDNEAERGGAFFNSGTLTLRGGNLSKNRCNQDQVTRGGAISNGGVLELVNVSFTNNTCDSGAAIHSEGGSVDVSGGTFANNRAYHDGAAIGARNATVKVASSTIVENNQLTDAARPQGTPGGALNFTAWDRSFLQSGYVPNEVNGEHIFTGCMTCHIRSSDPASTYTFALINPGHYTEQAIAAKIHADMSRYFPSTCGSTTEKAQCSVDVASYLVKNAVGPVSTVLYGDSPTANVTGSLIANNFGVGTSTRNCTMSGMSFTADSTGNLLDELTGSTCLASLPAANTQVKDIATDSWRLTYADQRTGAAVPSNCAGVTPPQPGLFPRYTPECWQEFSFSNAPVVAACTDERGVECHDPLAWN